MKSKLLVILALVIFTFGNVKAQNTQTKISDKVFFGGSIGLQFGDVTMIDLSPQVGYYVTKSLAIGMGFSYKYFKDTRYITDFSTSIYGGNAFSRLFLFGDLYAHAELEALNIEEFNPDLQEFNENRIWVYGVLVGGGFRRRIGQKAAINLEILYNLNHTRNTPYKNPVIRISFNF